MSTTIHIVGVLNQDIEYMQELRAVRRVLVTQQPAVWGVGFVIMGGITAYPVIFPDDGGHEDVMMATSGDTVSVQCDVNSYGVLVARRVDWINFL